MQPGTRGIEDERLALVVTGAEDVVVDPERDHVHSAAVQADELDRPLAHELARHDHRCRALGGSVVRDAAERPPPVPEETRKVSVLEVVDGHDGRHVDVRHGHREREVSDVERLQPGLELVRPTRRHDHRGDPGGAPAGDGRLPHLDGREARRRVPRTRGDEDGVVERSDRGEAADELAGIRLGAPEVARSEGEERDPDLHERILVL